MLSLQTLIILIIFRRRPVLLYFRNTSYRKRIILFRKKQSIQPRVRWKTALAPELPLKTWSPKVVSSNETWLQNHKPTGAWEDVRGIHQVWAHPITSSKAVVWHWVECSIILLSDKPIVTRGNSTCVFHLTNPDVDADKNGNERESLRENMHSCPCYV